METRSCKKCGETKPITEFTPRNKGSVARKTSCKTCHAAYVRLWKATPERRDYDRERSKEWQRKHPDYTRRTKLRLAYGLTLEEYEALSNAQGGVCAICHCLDRDIVKRTGKRRSLAVDHSHETGAVRGLLCGDCNRALGLMKEDPSVLTKMIAYLARHSAA